MVKDIFLFLCIGCITACAQTAKNTTILASTLQNSNQITYAIHVNAKTPFEIFIDDIPLERFYESGMNTTLELNPYLLSNGLHKLKVRYLPLESARDGLLQLGDMYF